MLGSEWTDRVSSFCSRQQRIVFKRENMSQLVQFRLYSRAQYALCGCQHSEALTQSKGVSFVSLWVAGRWITLCHLACFCKVVFELFSSNLCVPFAQAPPSLPCVLVRSIPGAPAFRTLCSLSSAMLCPKRAPLLGSMQHIGSVHLQLGGEH